MFKDRVPPKILLVEDNSNLSENIHELLTMEGYEVTHILKSAEQVEKEISKYPPDLVLIDIKLSGKKNGIELASQLRETSKTPIIFITSHSDKETINKVKIVRPEGFLVKPFSKESLFSSIEIAIENSSYSQGTVAKKSPINSETIFIRNRGFLQRIEVKEILFIEVHSNIYHIFTQMDRITIRNNIREFLKKLPKNRFFRVHRSFIVNIQNVKCFNSSMVKTGIFEIPMGRKYYQKLSKSVNRLQS